jgi:class 3 adenylate cyclase
LNTPAEPHDGLTAAGFADERPGVTSFVGREQELAALAAALGQARDERNCRLVTVIGSPGIGKSRLVREFTGTLREEATVVVGRCLSYGEGITYRPLAEIVRHLGPDPPAQVARLLEGDAHAEPVTRAVLGAVGLAETASGSDETFWAFRRLFEALARDRALVAVFEDMHWAEPTLLDLLESVAAFSGGAPIMLLCLARPELLERRPEWAVPGPDRIGLSLEPLSEGEARAMIGQLEPELDDEAFEQIVEMAEGNPLFLEQLVAMQREGAEPKLPPTVQALLSARIGQLAPAERNLLERASVEGRTFHRGAVASLLRKTEQSQIGSILMALLRKQLIRPSQPEFAGEDAFRFGHVLIREAAYESLPRQLRAELHEQVAAWLDHRPGREDEIVGYHLEQAYRHREQLHRIDDHARQLAERAGKRLAVSGSRAWARGDGRAAINLLSRATSLLPRGSPNRGVALVELGASLDLAGEYARRDQVAKDALEEARASGDRALEWRARLLPIRLIRGPKPTETRAEIKAELERAIAELEALGDDAALATAWYHLGRLHFASSHNRDAEDAFEQALSHAERAQDERTSSHVRGLLATALCYGPTPFDEVIARLDEILRSAGGKPSDRWLPLSQQACACTWTGRFEQARGRAAEARAILEELGGWGPLAGSVLPGQAAIEQVAGDSAGAERLLNEALELATRQGDEQLLPWLSTDLAETLCDQGRYDEAGRLALKVVEAAPGDDHSLRSASERVQAMVLAHLGQLPEAEFLARDALALALEGDDPIWTGEAHLTLAEVLRRSGKDAEAAGEARTAFELFERKGAVVLAERARRLLEGKPGEELTERARRTVTVVFADLVDSTKLGERLDPESLHSVLARYSERSAAALERHGGTVEKFIGDAVVGVFGLTELHEDDALRAVHAAVELREAVAVLSAEVARDSGVEIGVRIGVNTGEVFVGASGRRGPFATGDAVNVAARLEQAAGDGEILLGEQAYRLVERLVRAEPLDPLTVKGRAAKLRAWRLRELDGGDRLSPAPPVEVIQSSPTRPFVGRTKELHELRSTLEEEGARPPQRGDARGDEGAARTPGGGGRRRCLGGTHVPVPGPRGRLRLAGGPKAPEARTRRGAPIRRARRRQCAHRRLRRGVAGNRPCGAGAVGADPAGLCTAARGPCRDGRPGTSGPDPRSSPALELIRGHRLSARSAARVLAASTPPRPTPSSPAGTPSSRTGRSGL